MSVDDLKPGDSIIAWSQSQGRLVCVKLVMLEYQRDQSLGNLHLLVEGYDYSRPDPETGTVPRHRWSIPASKKGVLWEPGDDLDSPAAQALLSAFHLVYR